MSVAKQQLKSRIPEVVISTKIDERRRARLRRQRPFISMRKNFRPQRQFFPNVALQQPSAKREIVETGLRYHCLAHTAVRCPWTPAFLHPHRQLPPNFPDA